MKKYLSFIIGLIFIISIAVVPQKASASILEQCKLQPFEKLKGSDVNSDLAFRLAFEKARSQYHGYINCIFNRATDSLLKSSGPDTKNLNKPKEACLSDSSAQKLKTLLSDGSPENLLTPVMQAYQDYTAYINNLQTLWANNTPLTDFINGVERQQILKRMVDSEIQQSIVALDSAFIALKEMRQAFVIHQHFQCMIKNLETYRGILGNLRSIVHTMPGLFHNASTQQ